LVINGFNIEEGYIEDSEVQKLNKYEKELTNYINNIFSDIIAIKYDKKPSKYKKNYIEYQLYIVKKVSGTIKKIPYK
jgi:hypothetical protein